MIDRPKIILILTFLISFFTYSFWEVIKEKTGVRIFYPGVALSFVGYTFVIKLLVVRLAKYQPTFKSVAKIAMVIFLCSINNFIDELAFDPTKLQLNEYIGFLIIIIITYWNGDYFKRRKKELLSKI